MGRVFNLGAENQMGDNPHQIKVEIGNVTFSTTDSQATFRTNLNQILAGAVNIDGAVSAATDAADMNDVSVPTGAVTSNSITLTRSSNSTSGATYSVILFGTVYTANP